MKDGVYCLGLAIGCSELGLLFLVASFDARLQFKGRSGVPSDCWLSAGSEGFRLVKYPGAICMEFEMLIGRPEFSWSLNCFTNKLRYW